MNEVAVVERRSITVDMAHRYGMEAAAFEATLRATVFQEGSREEFAAFLLVAKHHNLNPVTREIFAMKKKGGGIIPVVSVDGWARLCNEHPALDGLEFEVVHGDGGKPFSTTCHIYRKDRSRPVSITEHYSECYRNTDPWKDMPYRMLRHKALIQCARVAFGFAGIYDEDEAERFADLRPARTDRRPPPPAPASSAPMIEHAPSMEMPAVPSTADVEKEVIPAGTDPAPARRFRAPPPPPPSTPEPTTLGEILEELRPQDFSEATAKFDAEETRSRFAKRAAASKDEDELASAWAEIIEPVQDEFFPPDLADVEKIYRFRKAELDDGP